MLQVQPVPSHSSLQPDVTELRQNIDVNVTVMDATEPLPVPGGAGQLGGALHPVLNVSSDPQSRTLFKTREVSVKGLRGECGGVG